MGPGGKVLKKHQRPLSSKAKQQQAMHDQIIQLTNNKPGSANQILSKSATNFKDEIAKQPRKTSGRPN